MWWFGIGVGALAVGGGVALVLYGRTFPPKRSFTGRTGIPVPPAPWDQRRNLMGSGLFLAIIGFVFMFVSLVLLTALS